MYFNQSKMTHNKFVLAVQTLGCPGTFLADWDDHAYVPENKASKHVPWNACREESLDILQSF